MSRTAVSLFTGAGGMDIGFSRAGIKPVWANDIVEDACITYQENHTGTAVRHGSILDLMPELNRHSGVDLLFGGPPCQGFSVAGKMDPNDERSKLVFSFIEAVRIVHPSAFVLENVRALGELEKFADIRARLIRDATSLGYNCTLVVLLASNFGVPQARERMFLVGFRGRANAPEQFKRHILSQKRKAPTLRDILLPLGRAGTSSNPKICRAKITIAARPVLRKSPYAGMMFNGQGRPLNPQGFGSTLPATMGGNRTPIVDEDHLFDGASPWIEEYHAYLMGGGKPKVSEKVPSRLRRLTVDEAALLQTFPKDYSFYGKQSSVYSQIGNAVPCDLAYAVAIAVNKTLDNSDCVISEPNQLRMAV